MQIANNPQSSHMSYVDFYQNISAIFYDKNEQRISYPSQTTLIFAKKQFDRYMHNVDFPIYNKNYCVHFAINRSHEFTIAGSVRCGKNSAIAHFETDIIEGTAICDLADDVGTGDEFVYETNGRDEFDYHNPFAITITFVKAKFGNVIIKTAEYSISLDRGNNWARIFNNVRKQRS